MLPVFLIFVAACSMAVYAYGTLPAWAAYQPYGVQAIVWTRELHWPLIALALVACLVLVALVASGKRRVWWLIGLAPVIGLLVHHITRDPLRGFAVLDDPKFVAAADAAKEGVKDEDWVLGVVLEGQAYAYPYASAYSTPVIVQTEGDKRLLLVWNAFANHAMARLISHELHGRDLEIVSMPANAVLLYNTKHGQFINGITGMTMSGESPAAVGQRVEVAKTTWKQWLGRHPATKLMEPPPNAIADAPNKPIEASFPMPAPPQPLPDTHVTVISTTRPVAVLSEYLSERPANISSPDMAELVFRDPETHVTKAFTRPRLVDNPLWFEPLWYRLTDGSFDELRKQQVPQTLLAAIQSLKGREFEFKSDLVAAVARAAQSMRPNLPPLKLAEYQESIWRAALETGAGAAHGGMIMGDRETKSAWNANGVALDGPMGRDQRRLDPIPVIEDCYWGVMKFWMQDLIPVDPRNAE